MRLLPWSFRGTEGDFLGLLIALDAVFPEHVEKASAYGAEKKDRDPDRQHEDVVLVLSDQPLGIKGRLLMVDSRASPDERESQGEQCASVAK